MDTTKRWGVALRVGVLLAVVDLFLMVRAVRTGPEAAPGAEVGVPSMVPAE